MSDLPARLERAGRGRAWAVGLGLALALVAAAAMAYQAPYRAMSRLQAAARAGDAARLDGLVDHEAYRASLERLARTRVEQSTAGAAREIDPLQAFGPTMAVVYARAAADRLVESGASPAGIAAVLRGEAPADPAGDLAAAARGAAPVPAACSRVCVARYESPSRFVARFVDAGGAASPLTLVWRRSGTAWRLSELRQEGC